MIVNHVYRVRLGGRDGTEVLEGLNDRGTRMAPYHRHVLGWSAEIEGSTVVLRARVSETDRIRVTLAARKFATALLATQNLDFQRPLVPESALPEPNGRHLLMGEGRTPRGPYRPRVKKPVPPVPPAARAPEGWTPGASSDPPR